MKLDFTWFEVFSDLLVNLAAGWLGAAFIVPNFSGVVWPSNFVILTMDVLLGIFCLVGAFRLKKASKKL